MKTPYHVRWGQPRRRTIKGHPLREARRAGALARFSVRAEEGYVGNYADYLARKTQEKEALSK